MNFTPRVFTPSPTQPKIWDVLCVANNGRIKKLREFLLCIRRLYDAGPPRMVLLVSAERPDERSPGFYQDLHRDYLQMFSAEERESFALLRPSASLGFEGLSSTTMAHFYQASRIFALFSLREGGPKCIAEALLCGLPVVVHRNFLSGMTPHLTPDVCSRFSDFETAHETLASALANLGSFSHDAGHLTDQLGEEHSLAVLKSCFATMYRKAGQDFDGELVHTDRLNVRLPAHLNDGIPWSRGIHGTADVSSREQLRILLESLRV